MSAFHSVVMDVRVPEYEQMKFSLFGQHWKVLGDILIPNMRIMF